MRPQPRVLLERLHVLLTKCLLTFNRGVFDNVMPEPAFFAGVGMAGTGDGKKEEADYKRLHSFPLIRVRDKWDGSSWKDDKRMTTHTDQSNSMLLWFSRSPIFVML